MQFSHELSHHYGPQVHLLEDVYLRTLLARLCHPETKQPVINQLISLIYTNLLKWVVNNEFPRSQKVLPTRMTATHPDAFYRGEILNDAQPVVSVNLARAGTFPSHICYDHLHSVMNPDLIRQDHILAARTTEDATQRVTGAEFGGMKIGGSVEKSIVLFPDPMGATGSTLISAINHYKKSVPGTPLKFIAMHLIITPEYLRNVLAVHPDMIIYAIRVDRGMSSQEVQDATPGKFWDKERGLNDKQYIVPGGGGFGEILNNSYV